METEKAEGEGEQLRVRERGGLRWARYARYSDYHDTIVAALTISAPGIDKAQLEEVTQLAHKICPYSHLITQAHDVELNVA